MARLGKTRVILTGGHAATTALAVVEEVIRRQSNWEIYWIGVQEAVEGKEVSTLESEVLPKRGVRFRPITAGRIQRRFTLRTIPALAKIPLGFIQAFSLVSKIKPKVVLSFGGFAAFPVVIAAWLKSIPVVIHEQTAVAGRANKASSFFARKIVLSRESSRKYFPAQKSVLTGNPILTQMEEVEPKKSLSKPPVVFITGGSRGSLTINNAAAAALSKFLSRYHVVHLTGPMDFEKFKSKKERLAPELKENYEVYSRIDPMKIDNFYSLADMVVARAGANTVSEIIATKRPAILIPLPFSYLDEQTMNARYAEEYGIATIVKQAELTGEKLLEALRDLENSWSKIASKVSGKKSPDKGAAKKLVDIMERVMR